MIGYFTFFAVAFLVYDMKTVRNKVITVGSIFEVDIAALIVLGCVLKWI